MGARLIDVKADDAVASGGKLDGQREADVAQSDDPYDRPPFGDSVLQFNAHEFITPFFCIRLDETASEWMMKLLL
jgi:hypothetical protein